MPLRRLFVLLLTLLLSGCGGEQVAESKPLLQVADRQISQGEFLAAFAKTVSPGQELSVTERQELQRAYLTQLIDRELTMAEARRRAITVTPAELANAIDEYRHDFPQGGLEAFLGERGLTLDEWQTELLESLTQQKLMAQVVEGRGQVSAAEIDAYYQEHRSEFDRPAQVRARQILVAGQTDGERLLTQLRQGADFSALAREHSVSPDAALGGDLGFFSRDEMPPAFEVVFTLPIGKVSPLVKSEYGYHIFLVEERRPAQRLSRQEAERQIRARLEAERRDELYQEWLQELRGQTVIVVDWRQLEQPQ
jgi:peptidyl-prolyl cis-trans isomerase C